ncbi:MAG: hypothetical protein GTO22_01215 [Gemmatimonadales bacterium]|nr:hypothetical protein [Gemmatimonadales bacterium]
MLRTKATVWLSRPSYTTGELWANPETVGAALLASHGTAGRGIEYIRTVAHALQLWGLHDSLIESPWERLRSWRPR